VTRLDKIIYFYYDLFRETLRFVILCFSNIASIETNDILGMILYFQHCMWEQ